MMNKEKYMKSYESIRNGYYRSSDVLNFKRLIEEHFDNTPLKFEELKIKLNIWDSKMKTNGIIVGILKDKRIEYIWVDEQGYVVREREPFEKNRFYRKQVENDG